MIPVLQALAGTPVFSRLYIEIRNSGHTLTDVENISYRQDFSGIATPGGFIHSVPVAVSYTIHFTDGSVAYFTQTDLEEDRLTTLLAEMKTWKTDTLLKAATSICQEVVYRNIKRAYNSHEENNDNDRNYDRTPATPRQSNAPAAPSISPADCKTSASITYECGRISGQYTLSTDDPEAAPSISPAD
jgi:hypothetical protein